MQGDLHFFDKKFAYVKKKQYFRNGFCDFLA